MKLTNKHFWAIGLIEADGYIGFNNNRSNLWSLTIKISLKNYNARAIYKLKSIFKVGKIFRSKDGMITYKISDRLKIKNFILPIFKLYSFRGTKYHDYLYFLEALNIMETIDNTELKHLKLTELKSSLNSLDPYHKKINPIFDNFPNLDIEFIKNNIDSSWFAGFIEGSSSSYGSFQINKRLQAVFEIGQKYNYKIIHILHKYLDVPSKIKYNIKTNYTSLSTKHPRVLNSLEICLNHKFLGIKSFEFRIWKYVKNTKLKSKKLKGYLLINKYRKSHNISNIKV